MPTDLLADDAEHPIPNVGVIDVVTNLKGGGAYYGLVIASPLKGDVKSQQRLLQKLKNYIGDFYSPQSLEMNGAPTPKKAKIYVKIHPDSDPVIFALLNQSRFWVEENQIAIIINTNLGEP